MIGKKCLRAEKSSSIVSREGNFFLDFSIYTIVIYVDVIACFHSFAECIRSDHRAFISVCITRYIAWKVIKFSYRFFQTKPRVGSNFLKTPFRICIVPTYFSLHTLFCFLLPKVYVYNLFDQTIRRTAFVNKTDIYIGSSIH